ncbi:hypothetical protein GCWU000282_03259 [Catonella morbi ATCC 51271]|uniref:Uncharacterized protein n=1 Tax=Catonella morbi ATCC 51271 TaxID=592026 RepID=V2XY94_9FIRM|nr:DUF5721 family protein [Catonella morbi]ESL01698.1 hypothetical protein GCWU000282_03259 [Catonella morbi ATCC 51271]
MVAFKIVDVKNFMNKLLIGEVFDNFLLVSFEISSFAKVTIDGVRNEAWYEDSESPGRYLSWKELRNKVSLLVKGDRIPLTMKAVFRLSETNTEKVAAKLGVNDAAEKDYGLFFNLKFENNEVNIVTGVSVTDFLISKELGNLWDEDLLKFLKYYQIAVEML